jgi:uncharacterized BrkB/YihY/UPF0761 family membrane protein
MSGEPSAPSEPSDEAPGTPTPPPPRSRFRDRAHVLKVRAESTRRAVESTSERLRARHASVRFAYEAIERDRRQAGALLAGGIAYRLFLWLLPTALFLVGLVGLIADLSSRSPERVAADAGLGAALAVTVAQAVEQSGRGAIYILLLGGVLMLWAGRSAVKALRLTSAVAWRLRPPPLTRALIASLTFTGISVGLLLLSGLLPLLHRGPLVADIFVEALTLAGVIAVAVWVQSSLPHPEGMQWTAFLPGAVLLGVGASLLRIVTEVYLAGRLGRVDDLYGALGLAAVFMAWLYLIGRLIVAAIAVNATRWRSEQTDEE